MSVGPAVWLACGARHAEDAVLREIDRLAAEGDAAPDPPVRVVVPSHSLRRHLNCRLARSRPRLGVLVQTLRALAAEVLDRAGEPLPLERAALEVLAAREAARQPALAEALAGLEDGTAALAASVRDLLDAGFGAPHLEAVLDRLAALGPAGGAEVERARAVAAVAAAVARSLDELHAGGSALLLRRAADHVAATGEGALPSRGVLVHGFANATGPATDLLEALIVHLGAKAVVDVPADPADPRRRDRGEVFTRRLRERLAGLRGEVEVAQGPPGPACIRALPAEGVDGEVRAVAAEIASLLEAGVVPERIAVVARRLADYEPALSVHFGRLGVPFTVQGGRGAANGARRLACAFARLLERGRETPLDTWLELRPGREAVEDLRIAFRLAGAVTLGDVADLDVGDMLGRGAELRIPVRTGLDAVGAGTRLEARCRRVSRQQLEHAVAEAQEVCALLAGGPGGTTARHLAAVRELGRWCRGTTGGEDVLGASLAAVAAAIPPGLELAWPELLLLLRRRLAGAGWAAVGGAGGGVQVLGVTQARGLTFDHLFLVGLNRDVFPRVVSEDPLLSDRLRLALSPVLPDLQGKALGHEEERYLFAHLVGAAPEVTVSWQAADDEGRVLPPSPLVQRLVLAGRVAPAGRTGGSPAAPLLATPAEHAIEAGLRRDRDLWEATLALAVDDARAPSAPAEVRRRILDEFDPDLRTPRGRQVGSLPGPYLGTLGAVAPFGELEGHLYVTTLEAVASCPWQAFLGRILRLEHAPDPAQVLGSLSPRLVGSVVHAVLARIAGGDEAGGTWEEALERAPRAPAWPTAAELEALAAGAASQIGRLAGIASPGLLAALARRALPALEVARRLEWQEAGPPVVGVEVSGLVTVEDEGGRRRSLRFACDRVDRRPGGEVVGTDYKSGQARDPARQEKTRRKHLLQAIRRGEALQAPAYASAAGGNGCGRYLNLHPRAPEPAREMAVAAGDREAGATFRETVAVLLAMWDRGLFPPRLLDPAGRAVPTACSRCELSEACLQHDTGARRRLVRWAGDGALSGVVGAWWRLPSLDTDGSEDS